MSLRKPPILNLARPAGIDFDLMPKALVNWDVSVQGRIDEATITILDVIGFDPWTGDGVTAKRVTAALRSIGEKPVTVQINSPGGDFFEGLAIYNALAQHPEVVTVQVLGMAASAASVIAMAGDRIEIAKAGFLMIHNTQWVAIGDRNMMRDTADIMEQFDTVAASLYADRSGMDAKAIGKLMDAETFMSGDVAVEKGFATALLGEEPEHDPAIKQSFAYRVDAALARQGVPRAERRKLIKELGTPSAAHHPTPGAGDKPDFSGFVADLKSFTA